MGIYRSEQGNKYRTWVPPAACILLASVEARADQVLIKRQRKLK